MQEIFNQPRAVLTLVVLFSLVSTLLVFLATILKYVELNHNYFYLKTPFYYNRFENRPVEPLIYSRGWQEYQLLLRKNLTFPFHGLINEDDYWDRVEAYFAENPLELEESGNAPVFEQRQVYTDYKPGNLARHAAQKISMLIHTDHNMDSHQKKDYAGWAANSIIPMSPKINLFLTKVPNYHTKRLIGTHMLCPSQRYNHIPGNEHIVHKDDAAYNAKAYGWHYDTRPHCFDPWRWMPKTYDLNDYAECLEIFGFLQSEEDSDEVRWIHKKAKDSHNAAGITVLTKKHKDDLLRDYGKKFTCGQHSDFIIQKYIGNPLLVNGKKFDFRVYMLIANIEPLVILYSDGFLRVSMSQYDIQSSDDNAHVTNTELAKQAVAHIEDTEFETAEELMNEQMWNYDRFQEYMLKEGKIEDKNWLEDFVRPEMKRSMLHLVRMHYEMFMRHPGIAELFGVDYMFDDDMHLWYLEVARSPAMQATTEAKGELQSKLIQDIINVQYCLLVGGNLEDVVEDSGFEFVYNGFKSDMDRYYGNLEEDCL